VSGAARGYSWPSFEDGNTAAEKHGATGDRRWRPLADHLAAEIVESAAWLTRPAFRRTVQAWSVAEAKAQLVDAWLDEHGLLDDDGAPRPANNLADRLHGRAANLRAAMGLDPASFARLLATFSGVVGGEDALAALKREGARLIEAHTAALTPGRAGNGATERANAAQTGVQRAETAP
jgi:hypothetical protein